MVAEKSLLQRIAEAMMATLWKLYALIMGLFGIDVRPAAPEMDDEASHREAQRERLIDDVHAQRPRPALEPSLGEKIKRTAAAMAIADTTRICGMLDPSLPGEADALEWLRGPGQFHLDQIASTSVMRIEDHIGGRPVAGLPPFRLPEPSVIALEPGHYAEEEELRNAVIARIVNTDPDNSPDPDEVEAEVERWLDRGATNADLERIATPLTDEDGDETTALEHDLTRE